MEESISGEIIYTIIITIIVCVVLTSAILGLIYLTYRNRKLYESEKALLEKKKADEINRLRIKVKNETLNDVANELHDNIGQILALMRISIKSLKKGLSDERIDVIDDLSEHALDDVRNLSYELKSGLKTRFELKKALSKLLNDVDRSGEITTALNWMQEFPNWEEEDQLILYRICQEFISNSIKHAKADHIALFFESSETSYTLKISDNGIGFQKDGLDKGAGIDNMRERASLIDAQLTLNTTLQKGTELIITKNRNYA